jgi:hypothetical protein
VGCMNVLGHFRADLEGAARQADVGHPEALGKPHRIEPVVLQEHDDGAEGPVFADPKVGERDVYWEGRCVAHILGDGLGLGHVATADGQRQRRVQPAQCACRLRSDDSRAANDEHGRLWIRCHVNLPRVDCFDAGEGCAWP